MRNWEVLTMFGGAYSMFLGVAILPNFLAIPLFVGGAVVFAIPTVLDREPAEAEE